METILETIIGGLFLYLLIELAEGRFMVNKKNHNFCMLNLKKVQLT